MGFAGKGEPVKLAGKGVAGRGVADERMAAHWNGVIACEVEGRDVQAVSASSVRSI